MLPHIPDFPGIVIAGATNAKTIASTGRRPDFICCLDSNADTWAAFNAKDFDWGDTTLVTHPCINPQIIRNWKGPLKIFRPMQLGYDFFDNVMPKMYDFVELGFVNAGCTVNTEMELATLLGATPAIISGVDFGFVDGRPRCSQFEWKNGDWAQLPDPPLQTRAGLRRSRAGCLTTDEMAVYKQNFFLLARTEATTVYSCSRGIIRPEEVSGYVNPMEVNTALRNKKLALCEPKEIESKYDGVLKEFGVAVEEGEGGVVRVVAIGEEKKKEEDPPKKTLVYQKMSDKGIKIVEKDLDKNRIE